MPKSKMWFVFYAAIGAGLLLGVVFYILFFSGITHDLAHNTLLGVVVAGALGVLIGFGYYLFFKLTLRAFTWPYLRRAQALVVRPIAPLRPIWSSTELDKLDEILTEALATLERLDLFSSAAKEIVATLDLERTLGHIVGTAAATMPADSGLIFLLDEERGCYTVRASYALPLPDEQVNAISFPAGEGVPGWVVTEGAPLIIADAQGDERVHSVVRQAGVQSLLSVPLVAGGQPLGVLNLFNCNRRDAFDDNDARLSSIYADLAAVAIENARLFDESVRERSKLAAILRDTTDAVIVLDQTERVLLLNQAAEQCLEMETEKVEGLPVCDLGVNDLVAALEAARAADEPVTREVVAPCGRNLYASVSPVRDVGWVAVMQDITPLKELDQLRTEWVAAVSHDLKNPVTTIQMSAMLLDKAGMLNEKQQELLARMQRGSEQLRSLVTDVLDLARLEAGPALRMGVVDPNDVVAKALAEVETLADDKDLSLSVDLPPDLPTVRGDAALLVRALVNLLSNGVKYTPREGRVAVCAQPQDGMLQFEVSDTGRGIPADALPHLFDRFYRVPGSEQSFEGSGLGLSIVKSVVEKHGGRVWVESEPGQGSTFAFTVPLNR